MEEIELSKLIIFTVCLVALCYGVVLGISFVTDCPKAMKRLSERIFKPALSKERKFIIRMEIPGDGFYYYKELELGYMWHTQKNHATRYTEEEAKAKYDGFPSEKQRYLTIGEYDDRL